MLLKCSHLNSLSFAVACEVEHFSASAKQAKAAKSGLHSIHPQAAVSKGAKCPQVDLWSASCCGQEHDSSITAETLVASER